MSKASQLKLKEITISMGLFDFDVICVVGDYANACKYTAWMFEDDYVEELGVSSNYGYEARGKCFFRPGYVPVLWIPRKPQDPREVATLAHECLHAVFHLFEWAAIPFDRSTEEVAAHSQTHILNTILTKLAKTTTKDRNK